MGSLVPRGIQLYYASDNGNLPGNPDIVTTDHGPINFVGIHRFKICHFSSDDTLDVRVPRKAGKGTSGLAGHPIVLCN